MSNEKKESNIKNISLINEEKTSINRKAIEHRATWMGLTYEEGLKAGADAEAIARKAISRCGNIHGADMKSNCAEPSSVADFAGVFLNPLGMNTFQMHVTECTENDLKLEFHYCPLVSAWQKLGFDDETCGKLCDIAMDGDRGIANAMGFQFELSDTIAGGGDVCKLHFHK